MLAILALLFNTFAVLRRRRAEKEEELGLRWTWLNTSILFLVSLLPAFSIPVIMTLWLIARHLLGASEGLFYDIFSFAWNFPPKAYQYYLLVFGGPLALFAFASFYYLFRNWLRTGARLKLNVFVVLVGLLAILAVLLLITYILELPSYSEVFGNLLVVFFFLFPAIVLLAMMEIIRRLRTWVAELLAPEKRFLSPAGQWFFSAIFAPSPLCLLLL